jgi:hypothetical protein
MKRTLFILGGAVCIGLLGLALYVGSLGFLIYVRQNLNGSLL